MIIFEAAVNTKQVIETRVWISRTNVGGLCGSHSGTNATLLKLSSKNHESLSSLVATSFFAHTHAQADQINQINYLRSTLNYKTS